MGEIAVSVILPVYNPGNGIRKCIESLQRQTLRDIEMIFVDDCGTDGAMEQVKEAAVLDSRIKYLINPHNIGSGPSRNRGIEAAEGEYLAFADPDDYLGEDFLELLYTKGVSTGADIVKGNRVLVDENGEEIKEKRKDNLNERIRRGLSIGENLCVYFSYDHWTAIYRRDWVMSSGARYGTSCNSQDVTFQLRVSYGTRKIEFAENAIYYYVTRKQSRVRDYSPKRIEGELLAACEQIGFFLSHGTEESTAVKYIAGKVRTFLRVSAFFMTIPSLENTVENVLSQYRKKLLELPFAYRISAFSFLVNSFLVYGANLTCYPYDDSRRNISFEEYLGIIKRLVNFVCEHPELGGQCRYYLLTAVENAVSFVDQKENGIYSGNEYRLIRKELSRLPDNGILTENDVLMRLFTDHNIDLFRFRKTWLEAVLKKTLPGTHEKGKVRESDPTTGKSIRTKDVFSKKELKREKEVSPKVSVILTVYNPGPGIRKCIQSLQRQSLHEIEMIFVDDCGTDDAMKIVQESAEKDRRIRCITNEKNLGIGLSRNRGIEAAKGEYLFFVDPDDYVADDFLELLYERGEATRADIVKGVFSIVDGENGSLISSHPNKLNTQIRKALVNGEQLCYLFTHEHLSALYRREWVMESGARQGTSRVGEDTTFLLRVCYGMKGIEFADSAIYYYVIRQGSAVNNFSPERMRGQFLAFQEELEFLLSHLEPDEEQFRYINKKIQSNLKIHIGNKLEAEQEELPDKRKGLQEAGDTFLQDLRRDVSALPFAEELAKRNRIINVFLNYGYNISPESYGMQWNKASFKDYLDVVSRIVDFICAHPKLGREYRDELWIAFEKAITFHSQDNQKPISHKEKLSALQHQADLLPDKGLLTDDFAAMKLYIDYGIDLFYLRKTMIGKQAKSILKTLRTSRKS